MYLGQIRQINMLKSLTTVYPCKCKKKIYNECNKTGKCDQGFRIGGGLNIVDGSQKDLKFPIKTYKVLARER